MMTLEEFRAVLGWCALINYGLIILWLLFFKMAHGWMHKLHGKFFNMTPENVDSSHFKLMGIFEILVLIFNLVPYLVLRIVFG
ncbi:MAG: DUF6868 family protein [Thermodesulfobacteriota bacterium]